MSPDIPDPMPAQATINNPFTDDQVFSVTFHPVMWPWLVKMLAEHGCDLSPAPWPSDPLGVPEYLAAITDAKMATWVARREAEQ
jgi:hypothetical protein